jgi:aminoglycoside phosphotransferase (APT) family kinase protein
LDEEHYRRDGSVCGLASSWPAAVLDPLPSALSTLTGAGGLSDAQRSEVERIVAAGAPLLDRTGAGRLLHGDLGPVHVWVDPGTATLTAIIDFGERASGDPIWEFVDYGPGVTEMLGGYEPEAAMQAEFAEAFALYRLLRTIPWAARLYTRGVTHVMDWFHLSLRQAAERLGE